MREEVVLRALEVELEARVLADLVEELRVLDLEVVDPSRVRHGELVLNHGQEELHHLEPRHPRRMPAHLGGQQRVEDVDAVDGEVHDLRAAHAQRLIGLWSPSRAALLELFVQRRDPAVTGEVWVLAKRLVHLVNGEAQLDENVHEPCALGSKDAVREEM